MNICIYTVHLFLYEFITFKVKSRLSNYCTFHISYDTTNTQKYKITFMKNTFLVDILSLLLVRPKTFINITSDGFHCHAIISLIGKQSFWTPHTSPTMIRCDVLTCSIHGIQQWHLILWSMSIYFPSSCWKKLFLGMRVRWKELHCYPFMCSKPVPNNVGSVEADIIPDNNIIRQIWSN